MRQHFIIFKKIDVKMRLVEPAIGDERCKHACTQHYVLLLNTACRLDSPEHEDGQTWGQT